MKLNWGTGIALFFITFAVGMVALVIATTKHDPGLVQKDYYALDLNYQERLERKQNAAALPIPPRVLVVAGEKSLTIQLPEGMDDAQGSAKFYRSSTVKDDFLVKIEKVPSLQIATDKMAAGRWHVELEWVAADKPYFWETAVVIP